MIVVIFNDSGHSDCGGGYGGGGEVFMCLR